LFQNKSDNLLGGIMKKKTKNIIILSVSAIAIFATGSVVGATAPSWLDQISVDSANQIDSAGKAKVAALTSDVQGQIIASVRAKMAPMVEAKKTDLQNQIQAYFDQKASAVTNTPEYQAAVADLDRIETNLLEGYKAQIDKAFAGK
jgi:hypothetical protein